MTDFESNKFSVRAVLAIISFTAAGVWYGASFMGGISAKLDRNREEISSLRVSVDQLNHAEQDVEKIKSDRWNYLMQRSYVRELHEENPNLVIPDVVKIHDDLDPNH